MRSLANSRVLRERRPQKPPGEWPKAAEEPLRSGPKAMKGMELRRASGAAPGARGSYDTPLFAWHCVSLSSLAAAKRASAGALWARERPKTRGMPVRLAATPLFEAPKAYFEGFFRTRWPFWTYLVSFGPCFAGKLAWKHRFWDELDHVGPLGTPKTWHCPLRSWASRRTTPPWCLGIGSSSSTAQASWRRMPSGATSGATAALGSTARSWNWGPASLPAAECLGLHGFSLVFICFSWVFYWFSMIFSRRPRKYGRCLLRARLIRLVMGHALPIDA